MSTNLLTKFLSSRRQGLSPRTIEFYKFTITPYLQHCQHCDGKITPETINSFLASVNGSTGNKFAYYRGIEVFVNYLYKIDYLKHNPLKKVDAPKPSKPILPSLTLEQVQYLIEQAESVRDKAIISLFADSGLRLSELANINPENINWQDNTVTVWGKANKERRAVFTERSTTLLKEWLSCPLNSSRDSFWGINYRGIQMMLKRLEKKTGAKCNPHTFRRTFASNLHRAGLDVEHIQRLGGWESLDMVLTYTRSVKFDDSLKLYRKLESNQ